MKDTTQSRIVGRLGLLPEVSTSNAAALSLSTWAPPRRRVEGSAKPLEGRKTPSPHIAVWGLSTRGNATVRNGTAPILPF
jgi:hypothetical protein